MHRYKYIRYVFNQGTGNPWLMNGLFLTNEDFKYFKIKERDIKKCKELFEWFSDNLNCPPFDDYNWSKDAVCWYYTKAKKHLLVMDKIVKILKKYLDIRIIKLDYPGKIVWKDKYQVVAETPDFYLK